MVKQVFQNNLPCIKKQRHRSDRGHFSTLDAGRGDATLRLGGCGLPHSMVSSGGEGRGDFLNSSFPARPFHMISEYAPHGAYTPTCRGQKDIHTPTRILFRRESASWGVAHRCSVSGGSGGGGRETKSAGGSLRSAQLRSALRGCGAVLLRDTLTLIFAAPFLR